MLSVVKKNLPWWLKIGGKIILARMPIKFSFWQRVGLFRHGQMDLAAYAMSIFDAHLDRAGISSAQLQGKKLLEIGPGDSIATAIIANAYGARAILIDAGAFATDIPENYSDLCDLLVGQGLPVPDLTQLESIYELLVECDAQYLTNGLDSWNQIESESIDFVFSQAVLEHIRKEGLLTLQRECVRVMKTNALASHRVDLKDHLGGALNNLRFSEKVWESEFFVKSGFYTNRIRMKEMLEIFVEAGFDCHVSDIRKWDALPTPKKKLDSDFSSLDDEELKVSGFDVVLRKNK